MFSREACLVSTLLLLSIVACTTAPADGASRGEAAVSDDDGADAARVRAHLVDQMQVCRTMNDEAKLPCDEAAINAAIASLEATYSHALPSTPQTKFGDVIQRFRDAYSVLCSTQMAPGAGLDCRQGMHDTLQVELLFALANPQGDTPRETERLTGFFEPQTRRGSGLRSEARCATDATHAQCLAGIRSNATTRFRATEEAMKPVAESAHAFCNGVLAVAIAGEPTAGPMPTREEEVAVCEMHFYSRLLLIAPMGP